jgi:hypothetical protein
MPPLETGEEDDLAKMRDVGVGMPSSQIGRVRQVLGCRAVHIAGPRRHCLAPIILRGGGAGVQCRGLLHVPSAVKGLARERVQRQPPQRWVCRKSSIGWVCCVRKTLACPARITRSPKERRGMGIVPSRSSDHRRMPASMMLAALMFWLPQPAQAQRVDVGGPAHTSGYRMRPAYVAREIRNKLRGPVREWDRPSACAGDCWTRSSSFLGSIACAAAPRCTLAVFIPLPPTLVWWFTGASLQIVGTRRHGTGAV